jgi:hypothetical protein
MGPSPRHYEEIKSTGTVVHATKPFKPPEPKKSVNCFAMDRPPHPGMIPVSTEQIRDGCFVISWQGQPTTMLITEAPQWYAYAGKILKANLAFTAVFALALLVVLVVYHERR